MGVKGQLSYEEEFQVIYECAPYSSHTKPILRCGLDLVTSFQRGQPGKRGERRGTLQWRNLTNVSSARWSKFRSTVITHVDSVYSWYDVMRITLYLWGLSKHPSHPSSHEKDIRQISIVGHSEKYWPAFCRTVQLIKNKEGLRCCHSQEGAKGARCLTVMWCPGYDPRTEKEH